jgi:hypothetical protein
MRDGMTWEISERSVSLLNEGFVTVALVIPEWVIDEPDIVVGVCPPPT